MIHRKFETGGFPINKRNPVLCFTEDMRIYVVYDRYSLKMASDNAKIVKCLGVWPGKYNTDCFLIDPKCYKDAPPEKHKDIDSALITVEFSKDTNEFQRILYRIPDPKKEDNPAPQDQFYIVSEDKVLLDYVNRVGLPKTSVYK